MNADHAEAQVLFCRHLLERPDTTSATMSSVDRYGFEMIAVSPSGRAAVRLGFPEECTTGEQVRAAMVAMVADARAFAEKHTPQGSRPNSRALTPAREAVVMPHTGPVTLLSRAFVGRDARRSTTLQDGVAAGRHGAGRVGGGRRRQEPARARAGARGRRRTAGSCSPDAAARPARTRRCDRGARRS